MQYLTSLLTVLWLVFSTAGCMAQLPGSGPQPKVKKKAIKYFELGKEQEKYRSYEEALLYYNQALAIEPGFSNAWFYGANCHHVLKNFKASGEWMEKALEHGHPRIDLINYYIAEAAFHQEDWAKAVASYKIFEERSAQKPVARRIAESAKVNRASAEYALANSGNRVEYDPHNLGDNVNTVFDEYLPNLTADEQTIFFTARRPGCIGGFNPEYRGYTEDFWYSVLEDGEWQPVENLGAPINTDKNEGAASFSPDGQLVFFTACSRVDGLGDCDLYYSRLVGKEWSEPKNLGPSVNTKGWESQPSISGDGRTLYFTSGRTGGYGGLDIWSTTLVGKQWTEPQNMGPTINTKANEMTPFIHADGRTLYFASDGHPGYGAMDLFLSRKAGGEWSEPENLGYPLNSPGSEANIFINAKGTQAYVNSNREGTLGKSDIFVFDLDKKIRPSYLTYVRGVVREKGSKKPLASKVTFMNVETGDTIRSIFSNKATGKYLLNLEPGYDYAAFVDRTGYLFESKAFSLKNLRDCETCPVKDDTYFEVDIDLQPLEVGVTVVMNNIFYETNKYDLLESSKSELRHLLTFMRRNPNVKVEIGGHTDNVGSVSDNQRLSKDRAAGVGAYLVEQGIDGDRITSKGYGETVAVDSNDTDEGRSRNRRTECKVVGI